MPKVSLEDIAKFIATAVSELSKEELTKLLEILKEEYNLEPTVNEVVVSATEEAVEEKTSFDVILQSDGGKKMPVIKAWKPLSGKSLMEAKADIEGAPTTLREGVSKEEAEAIKTALEEAGAEITLA